MTTQRYAVTQQSIETLFAWVRSGEIAIPEIQRPFVWDATKVRNLLDSLLQGYPVGYLIAWRNADVRLKDGTTSIGKRILIDGQQRITALMAALLGREVVNKEYQTVRIRIAFNPGTLKFEVANPAIEKDPSWVPDISVLFDQSASIIDTVNKYLEKNPTANKDDIYRSIEILRRITSNQIGLIELASNLDIETVTEIFIRVNSAGVELSQADFAMSKIAVNERYDGHALRKAIDYFCHLAVAPEFFRTVKNDKEFSSTEFFNKMSWLQKENDDLYDPNYTDMLRVAFTSQFQRGKLQDLVALLSGRNFETKQYEEEIVQNSFVKLKNGIMNFMNETHFKRFIMIIRSAGFVSPSLIGSQTALNFAYILYLTLRDAGVDDATIERQVRRWFALSILTGRYSGSPESAIDYDIRQIQQQGFSSFIENTISAELSDAFWDYGLPQKMDTSVATSPFFCAFRAAQVKLNDRGFLSSDISVRELVEIKSDIHHLFPKDYLKKKGCTKGQYNQIANYVVCQSEINIAIGNKEPKEYFSKVQEQCRGGEPKYGNISNEEKLRENLRMNCIPEGLENMTYEHYGDFLVQRRKLMAQRIKEYFKGL